MLYDIQSSDACRGLTIVVALVGSILCLVCSISFGSYGLWGPAVLQSLKFDLFFCSPNYLALNLIISSWAYLWTERTDIGMPGNYERHEIYRFSSSLVQFYFSHSNIRTSNIFTYYLAPTLGKIDMPALLTSQLETRPTPLQQQLIAPPILRRIWCPLVYSISTICRLILHCHQPGTRIDCEAIGGSSTKAYYDTTC